MKPLIKKHFFTLAIATALLCLIADTSILFSNTLSRTQKTLVIDPGHGGHDTGVRGPDHSFEKEITLSIAKKIKHQLKDKYNIVLTRTDDYWLDIHSRAEVANKNKADLFISIHTAGSFIHETSGINILYYVPQVIPETTDAPQPVSGLFSEDTSATDWFNTQKKYSPLSRAFAKSLFEQFSKNPRHSTPRISGLPALVLSGINLPAIMIEAGHSTNPSEEKLLLNPDYISDFSNEISTGVDNFFNKYTKSY